MRIHAFCAIAACVLVAAACAEAAPGGDTTTTLSTATSTTIRLSQTTGPAGTTTSAPPTTTHAPDHAMPELLVVGPEGVFLVEPGADPVQLVEGRAATAVDDGLGGLLYQIDAGRDWEQTEEPRTTIVWWVPAGSERPLDLLVPASDQDLTLEDAYAVDGSLTVLYRRSEGAVSFEMVDSLRSYDRATGSVAELMRGSAWESGFDIGSVGGGLIAGTSYTQVDASCFLLNLDGEVISSPANPSVPGCESPGCPDSCVLSPDGSGLAHVETRYVESTNTTTAHEIVVSDMATGEKIHTIEFPPGNGRISLDIADDWILVNRATGEEPLAALVVNAASPDIPAWEAPVAGVARFVTAPVTVRPAQFALRGDGLGIVELGQPMASAMPLLEARFGATSDEWTYDPENCRGDTERCCSAMTGSGCEDYFRAVTWDDVGLSVTFADDFRYPSDGVPHLTFWSTWGANGNTATLESVSIGTTEVALQAAYGNRLVRTIVGCGDDAPAYRLNEEMPIVFELSGPFGDPATTVTGMWAGNPGSC